MRRTRFVVFAAMVSTLLGLLPGTVRAQEIPPHRFDVEALVFGRTDPPADEHSLGINRTAGPSTFEGIEIQALIVCRENGDALTDQEEVVRAVLQSGQAVHFTSDDDPTDGFGEITSSGLFTDNNATEFRVIPPGPPVPSTVTVRIVDGRFHRLGGIVEVDVRLDIRVVRSDEGEVCQTDADRLVELRIVLELLPNEDTDPTSGFILAGVGRRHYTEDIDRTSVARAVCDTVVDSLPIPRVDDPGDTVPQLPNGRGDFHPCGQV